MTDVCLSAAQHSKVSVSFKRRRRSRVRDRGVLPKRYLNIASECWSHYMNKRKKRKRQQYTRTYTHIHIHTHFCNPKINRKHSRKERRCYFIVSRETRFNRTGSVCDPRSKILEWNLERVFRAGETEKEGREDLFLSIRNPRGKRASRERSRSVIRKKIVVSTFLQSTRREDARDDRKKEGTDRTFPI